jgi:MOSC domain-containing protein
MHPSTGQPDTVGTVSLLARYPVKSMRGEQLDQAEIEPRGLVGDRQWAVYTPDGGIGSGKSSRRFRRVDGLLDFRAGLDATAGTVPLIETPDGHRFPADDPEADALLSAALHQPLRLARETEVRHHDASALHLVTTAEVRRLAELLGDAVDTARFRPNVVLDVPGADFVEDEWTGRELRLGSEVVIRLGEGMPRCVMVGLPQGALGQDGRILKLLAQENQLLLGLKAEVVRGGSVRVGDAAVLA